MANRSKQRGTAHETATVNWFRENGWPYAKRITMKGSADEGDLDLGDGIAVTIECKNTKAMTLSQWLRELADEMENRGDDVGFVIAKKRGTTDVGEYYCILPVKVVARLLRRAGYAPERPRIRRKTRS